MPSYLREPSGSVCWNCDREAEETVAVTLRAPSGGQAALSLCRACYASSYLPLAAEAPEVLPGGERRKTVLVVDDDPDILAFLRLAFEDEGYAVETAANGLEALQRAGRRRPDAVVLDLRMPVMDGREFLKAWRETEIAATVPIVAISAHERSASADLLGVKAFMPKPFDLPALVGTVDSLLDATA